MHANAPDPRKQKWHEKMVRSSYFFGAVLFHLILFLLVATLVIWRPPPAPTNDVFHGVAVKMPPPPVQSQSSGAAAANPQFEPQPEVVPVVAPIPTITSVHNNFNVDTPKNLDASLSHLSQLTPVGAGLAAGASTGLSGNGEGYGAAGNGTGFVGVLYDLKQTPDKKPTNIANTQAELRQGKALNWRKSPATQNGLKALRTFVKTWDTSLLANYYQAPTPLFATQICIPLTESINAPKAFHVEGTVAPMRWIVIYHAWVIPPESGQFRFIGFADDFMVVRVGGQNVLDASWNGEELAPEANVKEAVGLGVERQPLKCGKWIQMEAGTPVDMQVLIGEGPGGHSGFLLMVQKQGVATPQGDYPVFQLQDSPIPDLDKTFHFSKKKMVFQLSP